MRASTYFLVSQLLPNSTGNLRCFQVTCSETPAFTHFASTVTKYNYFCKKTHSCNTQSLVLAVSVPPNCFQAHGGPPSLRYVRHGMHTPHQISSHLLSALRKQSHNVLFITRLPFPDGERPPECFPERTQPCKCRSKPWLAGAAPRLIGWPSPRPAPATAPGRARTSAAPGRARGRPRPPCRAGTEPSCIRSAKHQVPPSIPPALQTAKPQGFATKPLFLATSEARQCALNATTKQTRAPRHPARMQQQELELRAEPAAELSLPSLAMHSPAVRLPIQH